MSMLHLAQRSRKYSEIIHEKTTLPVIYMSMRRIQSTREGNIIPQTVYQNIGQKKLNIVQKEGLGDKNDEQYQCKTVSSVWDIDFSSFEDLDEMDFVYDDHQTK